MLEGEVGSSTWRNLRHEVVCLGLTAPFLDQFKVFAFRLEDTSDGEEALNVVCVDELFAPKHINKIECLRNHCLALRVNDAHNGVMCSLLQPRLLNQDAQFVLVAFVHLFEGLGHELVQLCVPVKDAQVRREEWNVPTC